jgi:hypothetical protein
MVLGNASLGSCPPHTQARTLIAHLPPPNLSRAMDRQAEFWRANERPGGGSDTHKEHPGKLKAPAQVVTVP